MLGDVSPAEFIPIIEQTSLARPTTQWVLDMAMDQLAAWQRGGLAIMLSVNISAANLGETDLSERITTGLTRRELLCSSLEIELTESAIMDQPDQAHGHAASLQRCRCLPCYR
jgi:EAL domain-containing protein (putative c-di-GMP-specific phosphodiesterase class I)